MLTSGRAGVDLTPLKIQFRMSTPVCLTYPFIFFDGVVAHLMNRYLDPEGYRALPSKRVVSKAGNVGLPIKRTSKDGISVYHASVSIFDVKDAYTTTIYKRFCEKYLNLNIIRKKKIDRRRGMFRDFMIKLVYVPARRVTFYACGDAESLEQLLSALPGLGKKTAIGFGMIRDFTIKDVRRDRSLVHEGKAMRPIPVELVKYAEEVVPMAYRAPYWAKENVKPCVPPFAGVEL